MRQTLSRGMFAAAAATSVLSLCGSPALADSFADGAATNAPSAVPDAALHDAQGHGHGRGDQGVEDGLDGTSDLSTGAVADGAAVGSPGVGSGNTAQVPVEVPLNLCGNTVDVVAALNPAFGNSCARQDPPGGGYGEDDTPPPTTPPPATPPPTTPPGEETPPPPTDDETPPPPTGEETPPPPGVEHPPVMAETGAGTNTLGAAAAGLALIAGGSILYRRGKAAAVRP
ncbi:chaplin [Streptomyces sp. NPDC048182]|uniref:chaplin n=1 Tax=Streptomyces sp. NPDC048182 TaxID=3365507 RepID=UPI0037215951